MRFVVKDEQILVQVTGRAASEQPDGSVKPCDRASEWPPHYSSSFRWGMAVITTSSPQPHRGRLHCRHFAGKEMEAQNS